MNCLLGKSASSTTPQAWPTGPSKYTGFGEKLCSLFKNWLFFFIQTKLGTDILTYYIRVCLCLYICYYCWLFIALGSGDCLTIHNPRKTKSLRYVQTIYTVTSQSEAMPHYTALSNSNQTQSGARLVGNWPSTLFICPFDIFQSQHSALTKKLSSVWV